MRILCLFFLFQQTISYSMKTPLAGEEWNITTQETEGSIYRN